MIIPCIMLKWILGIDVEISIHDFRANCSYASLIRTLFLSKGFWQSSRYYRGSWFSRVPFCIPVIEPSFESRRKQEYWVCSIIKVTLVQSYDVCNICIYVTKFFQYAIWVTWFSCINIINCRNVRFHIPLEIRNKLLSSWQKSALNRWCRQSISSVVNNSIPKISRG